MRRTRAGIPAGLVAGARPEGIITAEKVTAVIDVMILMVPGLMCIGEPRLHISMQSAPLRLPDLFFFLLSSSKNWSNNGLSDILRALASGLSEDSGQRLLPQFHFPHQHRRSTKVRTYEVSSCKPFPNKKGVSMSKKKSATSTPFFARYLEGQVGSTQTSAEVRSSSGRAYAKAKAKPAPKTLVTLKFPSDSDELHYFPY